MAGITAATSWAITSMHCRAGLSSCAASRRIATLSRHIAEPGSPHTLHCIGEQQNLVVSEHEGGQRGKPAGGTPPPAGGKKTTFRFRFVRETIKIVFIDPSAADERYGGSGDHAIIEGELIRPTTKSSTVIVFMHPSGIQNLLPMPVALARAGCHVATCCSRYPNNDTCLIMEKVVMDLGACVRHLKEKLGYTTVLLT